MTVLGQHRKPLLILHAFIQIALTISLCLLRVASRRPMSFHRSTRSARCTRTLYRIATRLHICLLNMHNRSASLPFRQLRAVWYTHNPSSHLRCSCLCGCNHNFVFLSVLPVSVASDHNNMQMEIWMCAARLIRFPIFLSLQFFVFVSLSAKFIFGFGSVVLRFFYFVVVHDAVAFSSAHVWCISALVCASICTIVAVARSHPLQKRHTNTQQQQKRFIIFAALFRAHRDQKQLQQQQQHRVGVAFSCNFRMHRDATNGFACVPAQIDSTHIWWSFFGMPGNDNI